VPQALVASDRRPAVGPLDGSDLRVRSRKLLGQLRGHVARAVADTYEFPVLERLRDDAVHRRRQYRAVLYVGTTIDTSGVRTWDARPVGDRLGRCPSNPNL
jgi:hypothetical protein